LTRFRGSSPAFFIGRYDIRFASEYDLAGREEFPDHRTERAPHQKPRASTTRGIRFGLLIAHCFAQWELVFAIGAENRRRGFAPTETSSSVGKKWREFSKISCDPIRQPN